MLACSLSMSSDETEFIYLILFQSSMSFRSQFLPGSIRPSPEIINNANLASYPWYCTSTVFVS